MTDTDAIKVALDDVRNETAGLRQDLQLAQAGWLGNVDAIGKLATKVEANGVHMRYVVALAAVPATIVMLLGAATLVLVGLRIVGAALELFKRGETLALW